MNQTLQKLADEASKTAAAWRKQMQRDGFTKREQLAPKDANVADMSPAACALFHDYQRSQNKLDQEAGSPSQSSMPGMDEEEEQRGKAGGGKAPAAPKAGKKGSKGAHLSVQPGGFPDPSTVQTPPDMERKIVAPDRFAELRAASAAESIQKAKPSAKVQQLDEQPYVVTSVAENYVVVTRCTHEDQWTGDTIETLQGRDGDDWAGLVFSTGPGKSPKHVLCNAAQSLAVVAGDPLANVSLEASGQ